MATAIGGARARGGPLAADAYERVLAGGAIVLLLAVAGALVRGRAELGRVPIEIWPHLASIVVALALTPRMLLGRRGDRAHRVLGWVWAAAMLVTAGSSFAIRQLGHGGFSPIHALSILTLAMVPRLIWTARTHQVARHRGVVRGFVTGALLVAGGFTFGFDRMLGHWLFA